MNMVYTRTSRASSALFEKLADVPTALSVEYIPIGDKPEWFAVWREGEQIYSIYLGQDEDGRIAKRIEGQTQRGQTEERKTLQVLTLKEIKAARAPKPVLPSTYCPLHETVQLWCVTCIKARSASMAIKRGICIRESA